MEKLLGLEVGRKYSFKGIHPQEGHAEVTELSEFNIYWATMRRQGWYNGKPFPFDADGKYIGASRWSIPDLEFDLGPIETPEMELQAEQELAFEKDEMGKEMELAIEKELDDSGEEELPL